MILVNEALEKKNLEVEDLPLALQERVRRLDSMCQNLSKAWSEYEEDGEKDDETNERFDKIESDIESTDKKLSKSIMDFNPAPVAPVTPPAEPVAPVTPPAEPVAPVVEKSKGGGSGWGIFLAVAATVALAAIGVKYVKK